MKTMLGHTWRKGSGCESFWCQPYTMIRGYSMPIMTEQSPQERKHQETPRCLACMYKPCCVWHRTSLEQPIRKGR